MGHYASEMMPENSELNTLRSESDRLKEILARSPLSAFTVADFIRIQKLLEYRPSRLHVNEQAKQSIKEEIKELRSHLAKVTK